eukprot:gene17296-22833_t
MHLYYGGSKSCDHWHQGPGFVTSHITFSLQYERALQAINPSISLPYWDFTLESTFYDSDTFRDSGVFSEDWFGNNTYHTIKNGRFSYISVMKNAVNFSSVYSPQGLLRSPWNSDPTPYMTRSNNIYGVTNNLKPSGCAEYHRAMSFRDWKNLAKQLNSNAHGHIHELMGGSWNPILTVKKPVTNPITGKDAYEFLHATESYSKILWRYSYLVCPEKISKCLSSNYYNDDAESLKDQTPIQIISSTGIIKSLVFFDKNGNEITSWQNKTSKSLYDVLPGYTIDESNAIFQRIMDILCSPGHIGDMFQATSTNDVTFWVLHPTLDRLWHRLRLNANNGVIDFDDTWPDSEQTCNGHYSYDPTPFKNIFDSNNVVYTNIQLYDIVNPSLDSFPYIYEHFRWSHCAALGLDMSGTTN